MREEEKRKETEEKTEKADNVKAAASGRGRKKRGGRVKRLLLIFACIFAVTAVAGYVMIKPEYDRYKVIVYEKLSNMDRADFSRLPDTEIFDSDGERIGIINAGHYEYVPISEISENIQAAYIAQEDKRFLSHNGVDWIATARAGLVLIKNGGRITQGGSTITQQVIKNTFLTQDRTFSRKIIEILMAPELEKKYTKADIMEFYCNTNYYGNRCYGVQAASRFYFGKDASELTVPEAATLVGISNSPGRYDPVTHPEESKEKRNRVLNSMLKNELITQEEYNTYSASPLVIVEEQQEGTDESYESSYALHCAALELMKLDGFDFEYTFDSKAVYEAYTESYDEAYSEKSSELRSGGYRIYTSIDTDIQNTVQEELDSVLSDFTELQENGKLALQGAGVIVDNETGYVVAAVGGRGTEDPLNRAYNSARQPGSCIKPILDYGPAFDTGEYYPARIMNDYYFEGGPRNSSGTYRGNVTVRQALNLSLNTVAWQVLDDIGIKYGMSYLDKMQFQKLSYIDSSVNSVSIGGFTNGVRPVDMAKAYSTLADGGIYRDNTCILKIEHSELGDLTKNEKVRSERVYREDTAYMITDILKGTFTEGTAGGLELEGGMPCAGKTGTTNDSKDTWFCGYTRYYTGAFWVGYDLPQAMPGVYGATYAGKIWKQAMDRIHEGLAPIDWEMPSTVEERTDESTGITDLRSTTDELRAEQSLKEKEQNRLEEECAKLLSTYEDTVINSVPDVYTVRAQYDELMEKLPLIDNSETRREMLERLETVHEKNEAIVEGMADVIERYEEQKAIEDERLKAMEESQAEENRKAAEEEINKKEVENAIEGLEALKYRSDETEELVDSAIEKLELIEGYPEEEEYAERLYRAVESLSSLPTEEEWQRAEDERKAREEALRQSQSAASQELREEISEKANEVLNPTKAPKEGIDGGPGVM